MRVIRRFANCTQYRGGVVTVGNFDGCHRGHLFVFKKVIERAKAVNGPSVVLSFEPHTQSVLAPSCTSEGMLKVLSPSHEKAFLIEKSGIDALVLAPFGGRMKKMDAISFLENIIFKYLAPKEIVLGYDHRFGAKRQGGYDLVRKACEKYRVRVHRARSLGFQGYTISSTVIRELVALGRMEAASSLLGRPYFIRGPVVRGYGRGRQLGFPTANVAVEREKLLMPDGVYYGVICIDKKKWNAVVSLGSRPSFGVAVERALEVHIPGYSGDLYGRKVDLFVEGFIRQQQVFRNIKELEKKITDDIAVMINKKNQKEESLESYC